MTWQDKTRQDKTRHDTTRHDETKRDEIRQDMTRQSQDKSNTKTREDERRQDKTRQDKTRQDKTRQGKARQDNTRQHKNQALFKNIELLMKDSALFCFECRHNWHDRVMDNLSFPLVEKGRPEEDWILYRPIRNAIKNSSVSLDYTHTYIYTYWVSWEFLIWSDPTSS